MKTLLTSVFAALVLAPSALGADVMSLNITSPPGDPFGQGASVSASTPGESLALNWFGFGFDTPRRGQGVSVSLDAPEGSSGVGFGVQPGEFLQVGTYLDAGPSVYPLPSDRPVMGLGLNGQGCADLKGSFVVTRADYSPYGNLYAFDATFAVTECNGAPTVVSGSVSFVDDVVETVIDRKTKLRNGIVTVTGKTFCSLPRDVTTSVSVNQPVEITEAYAQMWLGPTPCTPGGLVPWSATMQSLEGRAFRAGEARVATFVEVEPGLLDLRELTVRLAGR